MYLHNFLLTDTMLNNLTNDFLDFTTARFLKSFFHFDANSENSYQIVDEKYLKKSFTEILSAE